MDVIAETLSHAHARAIRDHLRLIRYPTPHAHAVDFSPRCLRGPTALGRADVEWERGFGGVGTMPSRCDTVGALSTQAQVKLVDKCDLGWSREAEGLPASTRAYARGQDATGESTFPSIAPRRQPERTNDTEDTTLPASSQSHRKRHDPLEARLRLFTAHSSFVRSVLRHVARARGRHHSLLLPDRHIVDLLALGVHSIDHNVYDPAVLRQGRPNGHGRLAV